MFFDRFRNNMTKKLLIGLHGKARVGKDTVAKHLIAKHNLLRYGPSVRVKLTTAAMFDFPVEYLDDDNMKDQMDPFWQMTYRQMAQKVGKESSRDVFGDDIWMRHVERTLQNLDDDVTGIILPDIRYESEVTWIKAHGGEVMYIIRESAPKITGFEGHDGERGLPIELANYIIYNDSTIGGMLEQADQLFKYTRDNQLKKVNKTEVVPGYAGDPPGTFPGSDF